MKQPAPQIQPKPVPHSALGRADLLCALALAKQHALAEHGLAQAAGYVRTAVVGEQDELEEPDPKRRLKMREPRPDDPKPPKAATEARPQARFWAVTERRPVTPRPTDEAAQTGARSPLLPSDWQPNPSHAAPAWQPIAPAARLMPALKRSLQAQRRGALDVARLVHCLSHVKTLRRLPRRAVKGWTDRLLLVLDFSDPLLPYRADMLQLAHDLRRWVGRASLQVRIVNDPRYPLGAWREWNPARQATAQNLQAEAGQGWSSATTGTRVMLVSELGLMAPDAGRTSDAWAAWLRELGHQGADLQVWCPLPLGLSSEPADAPSGWQQAAATLPRVPVVHWSAGDHLRLRPLASAERHRTHERIQLATQLRTLLATVARVEPNLLRALRLGLEPLAIDAGLEHLAWDHPHMSSHHSARALKSASLPGYRAAFAGLPSTQKITALDTLLAHHTPHNPLLAHVETLAWAAYATPDERAARQSQVAGAMDVMLRFANDPWQLSAVARAEVCDFMARHLRDADAPTRALCSPYMSRLWVALHRERQGELPLTQTLEGLNTLDVAQALGRAVAPQPHWLALDDEHGWLMLKREKPPNNRLLDDRSIDFHAISIHLGQEVPLWKEAHTTRNIAVARLPWGLEQRQVGDWWKLFFAPFPPPLVDGPIRLDTGLETLTIEEIPRPAWALEWARDRQGLYALASNPWGPPIRVPVPNFIKAVASNKVYLYRSGVMEPFPLGDCEVALAFDDVGLKADLIIKTTQSQSFRYLPPGQFTMGSPPGEADRDDDEGPQHQVTLTQGLWLADTACTQGLWLAVMGGKNPSSFKGDADFPVECVSWDDVQTFLVKLQAFLPPDVEAVLPTEAEWEYACRAGAGTSTPYSFGENINPSQVNYYGDYPYNGAAKGKYREKTIAVKALPANAWGFFQMHGNVWEWCADAMRTYSADAVVDPSGATGKGVEIFAVRGGSWTFNAQGARSAQRFRLGRGRRSFDLGFRFALRSKSQAGAGGPVLGGRSTPVLDVARDGPNFSAQYDLRQSSAKSGADHGRSSDKEQGKKRGKKSGTLNALANLFKKPKP